MRLILLTRMSWYTQGVLSVLCEPVSGCRTDAEIDEGLGHEGLPLGECYRASKFVFLTTDEMTFLVEVCVDASELL